VHLIYYPPYHSKYNPIERCWAALENYWNGALLTTIDEALRWAANMTWKGVSPLVRLVEGIYPKQISVPKHELTAFEQQWQRSDILPKWDISIFPV
jgi:transposase